MYFQGRRAYNNSFKDDFLLVESKTSRFTSITIDILKPGTEYSISVTAFTKKGEGARSSAVTVSTPAKGISQHHHSVLTSQAEKPLGTDSNRTISKRSSECWLLIGHKKCFVL